MALARRVLSFDAALKLLEFGCNQRLLFYVFVLVRRSLVVKVLVRLLGDLGRRQRGHIDKGWDRRNFLDDDLLEESSV